MMVPRTNILGKRVGKIDPGSLPAYVASGGFLALRKALTLQPEEIVHEIMAAHLIGRGGAAFSAGFKWAAVRRETARPKYVVCNADESEPGTFKDRYLLEGDPFRIVEAMAISAYAVGANRGFLYVRGEYPLAYKRLAHAVAESRRAGYLGLNLWNTEFCFDIEIYRGAGAYVCGEETALFESIEGRRGQPRLKPPFPTTNGLFGQPTLINNVETLANVPDIVLNGGQWYRTLGPLTNPGPKLYAVSGHVRKPGVYEATMDLTLQELIYELAGGIPGGRRVQAVLVGGAAGTFLRPDQLDVALGFDTLRTIGATLGSGAVMVLDDSVDLWNVLRRVTRFFQHESCGKCFPCQLGTQRQAEIVTRLAAGNVHPGDGAALTDIGLTMRDASICGLGQMASSALLSAFSQFSLLPREDEL